MWCWKLLLLVVVAEGARCRTYSTSLQDGSRGFCTGLVNYDYFVENDQVSQEVLERAALEKLQSLATPRILLHALPSACLEALKTAICSTVFPRCELIHPFFLSPINPDITPGTLLNDDVLQPLPEVECLARNLTWIQGAGCFAALPRLPCRDSTCFTPIVSSLSPLGKCPRISGLFFSFLQTVVPDGDPDVTREHRTILQAKNCSDPNAASQACLTQPFTVNVLTLLGLAPDCTEQRIVSGLPVDVFPVAEQPSLAGLIKFNLGLLQRVDTCGIGPNGVPLDCAALEQVYTCAPPTEGPTPSLQRRYDILEEDSICYDSVAAEVNQDKFLIHALAMADASIQESPFDQQTCFASHKLNLYKTVHFVPDFPGQAPFSSSFDDSEREKPRSTSWDSQACPIRRDGNTWYSNFGVEPLCVSQDGKDRGFNAQQCLDLSVRQAAALVPSFLPFGCQAALREMTCSQAYRKQEVKALCLIPDALGGCDVSNPIEAILQDRAAFVFSLPRFPSQKLCRLVKRECAPFLQSVPILQELNCEGTVGTGTSTKCQNPSLGGIWSCDADPAFAQLPEFPTSTHQAFLKDGDLPFLRQYAELTNMPPEKLFTAFSSKVLEPTLTQGFFNPDGFIDVKDAKDMQDRFCSCPAPLVAPDDPFAETINGTCCAVPCLGTMISEPRARRYFNVQLVLSSLGLICSVFMVATWGVFREKRKQYLTFWFSFCSFHNSLAVFLLLVSSKGELSNALCLDNSTPKTMGNSGFSFCTFEAVWFLFFATGQCTWWGLSAVDLFRRVVLIAPDWENEKAWYHGFAWGISAAVCLAGLVDRNLGFQAPMPVCFFSGSIAPWKELVIFYNYVAFVTVIGTVFMMTVLRSIGKHLQRLRKSPLASSTRSTTYQYFRAPTLFVFFFIFIWTSILSIRFELLGNEDTYVERATSWIECLLVNSLVMTDPARNPNADTSMLIGLPHEEFGCGVVQPGDIGDGALVLLIVVITGQSLFVFLIFGARFHNLRLWAKLFKQFVEKRRHFGLSSTAVATSRPTQLVSDSSLMSSHSKSAEPKSAEVMTQVTDLSSSRMPQFALVQPNQSKN